MSVKEVVDKDSKLRMWRIYDNDSSEIMLVIMEDGDLTFYKCLNEGDWE